VVAFNLSSPVLAEALRAGNADLLQSCFALIVALERSHRVSVLILPHDLRPGPIGGDDDVAIACRLSVLLERGARPIPHHLFVTGNAPEMKELVGLVDLVITGRMHLAIAALGMAVPVVALGYQGKFDGMMQRFDLSRMICDPQRFDGAELSARCVQLLENVVGYRTALRQRLPEVLALARANFAAAQPRHPSAMLKASDAN
jgi:polysaccharide pyruvyl transferase WcaK-like protein